MARRTLHDEFFKRAKAEGYLARSAYKLLEINDKRKIIRKGDAVLDVGCAPGSWLQVAAELVGPRGVVVGFDLKEVDRERAQLGENVRTIVADAVTVSSAELIELVQGIGDQASGMREGGEKRPKRERGLGGGSTSDLPADSHVPDTKKDVQREGCEGREGREGGKAGIGAGIGAGNGAGNGGRLFDVLLSDMAPDTTGSGDEFLSERLCRTVLEMLPGVLRPGGNLAMKVLEGEPYPQLLRDSAAMFVSCKGIKPKATRDVSREIYVVGIRYKGPGR